MDNLSPTMLQYLIQALRQGTINPNPPLSLTAQHMFMPQQDPRNVQEPNMGLLGQAVQDVQRRKLEQNRMLDL